MAGIRTLVPKKAGLSGTVLEKLKKEFNLSDANINDITYWNDPHSPYAGTIINTDPQAQYLCYPYPFSEGEFVGEFPEGVIWEEKD